MTNLLGTSAVAGTPGVEGDNTAGGVGVFGKSTTGTSAGVQGNCTATTGGGSGVYGNSSAPSGAGVFGEGTLYGVLGKAYGGNGVTGYAMGLSGGEYGVYGNAAASPNGTGVNGIGGQTGVFGSGTAEGVMGQSSTAGAYGVFGNVIGNGSNGTAYGVIGTCDFNNGYGVYGQGSVVGAMGISGNIGVYGTSSSGLSAGYAGYFNGQVRVLGFLTKSGGGYRIDHPSDPENKYLNHCFVESPEMLNVYRGRAIFDANGNAEVSMPSYFNDANELPEYILSPIGAPMPNLHISKEISNGSFTLSGGVPDKSASWQVSAARADKWAKANHPGVEIEKSKEEKGLFLHPELVDKDRTLSIDPVRRQPEHQVRNIKK